MRNVDKQPEHAIQVVPRSGEILHPAFSIRAYYFLLRNATNKEPVLFWIVGNSFRDQLRVAEGKRDRRIRRSRFLLRKLLPNLLEIGIVPYCLEPSVAHWNKSQLAPLQAA